LGTHQVWQATKGSQTFEFGGKQKGGGRGLAREPQKEARKIDPPSIDEIRPQKEEEKPKNTLTTKGAKGKKKKLQVERANADALALVHGGLEVSKGDRDSRGGRTLLTPRRCQRLLPFDCGKRNDPGQGKLGAQSKGARDNLQPVGVSGG